MDFKNLLITFFLLFSGITHSVSKNLEEYVISERSSYEFRYNSLDESSENNFFIKEIARLNFLNLYRTQYSMGYDLDVGITVLPGNKLEVNCNMLKTRLDGDVFYKEFDMSDVMAPSAYNLKIRVSNDGGWVEDIFVENLFFSELTGTTVQLAAAYLSGELIFEISKIEFSYNENDKAVFERRISDINDYLALSQLSSFQLNKSELIDPEDRTALLSSCFKIYDLERYLSIVSVELADVSFKIPIGYQNFIAGNLNILDSHKRRLNTLFDQTNDSSVFMFDDEIMGQAAKTLTGIQLNYLDELKNHSFFYEPMYQYMASFFNDDFSFALLINGLNQQFRFSGSIANSSENFEERFSNILLEQYINISDSLILLEKFHEAGILLESAEVVCRSVRSTQCEVLIYNSLSTTKWGIYDAYISVALSAMEAASLGMAYEYLDMASEFQSNNKSFITTNGFTQVEYEKLAWEYFQLGIVEYKSELFEEALSDFSQARELYLMLGITKYDEVISKNINNAKQYLEHIQDAEGGRLE